MKKNFKRRAFIKKAGVAAAAATAVSSFPAPSIASDKVKQLASFISLTVLFNFFSRSLLNGLSFNHKELALVIRPVSLDENPGIPIPTVQLSPLILSNSSTSFLIVSIPDS